MWPVDPNWQMTALYLLALALMVLPMMLIARLVPTAAPSERPFITWILLSPTTAARSSPAGHRSRLLLRALVLFGALALGYWLYWQTVRAFQIRGLALSYLASPLFLLGIEFLVAVTTLCFLRGDGSFPVLHRRPWAARSIAEFWGSRWNLWVSDWFRHVIFQPLRRRPVMALFLAFAISGLLHEWVINVPLYFVTGRVLFGTMMVYFLLQAVGILAERRFLKHRPGLMRAFAWLVVFVPSPLVINEGILRTLHLWPKQS